MTIAYHRGRLSATVPQRHSVPQSMLAVGLSEDAVQTFLGRLGQDARVQIGCINSPTSITVTGDETQLRLLESSLKEQGHITRKLNVDVAYHSVYMKAIEEEYLASMSSICAGKVDQCIPMISSVTGNIIPHGRLRDPTYWTTNLVYQVRFLQATYLLCTQSGQPPRRHLSGQAQSLRGITDLMEIGPHSTLQGPIRDIMKGSKSQIPLNYLSALNRSKDAAQCILEAIGTLWSLGYPVNLMKANGLLENSCAVLTELPAYQFNHSQRYWSEDRISTDMRLRPHPPHELLGTWMPSSNPLEARWRNFLTMERLPWATDHHVSLLDLVSG